MRSALLVHVLTRGEGLGEQLLSFTCNKSVLLEQLDSIQAHWVLLKQEFFEQCAQVSKYTSAACIVAS